MNPYGPSKRFSMNYLDTLDHEQPAMSNHLSMNYLDTMNTSTRPKRFSMNFMDSIGSLSQGSRQSWGRGRSNENGLMDHYPLTAANTKTLVANIDMLANYMLGRYGTEFVCGQEEWRKLLELRSFLYMRLLNDATIDPSSTPLDWVSYYYLLYPQCQWYLKRSLQQLCNIQILYSVFCFYLFAHENKV